MKILVAIDSSPAAESVLTSILARPWPAASSFEVLTVAGSEDEDVTRRAISISEDAARRLCSANLDASAFMMHGRAKAVIVDRARQMAADLIILGSHNSRHILLGGVASAVIRHAYCSVEIVRNPGDFSRGMKLLLATDGSEPSLAAARAIATRPWPAGTEARLLSAVELSLTLLQSTLEPPYVSDQLLETQRADAMKRAEQAVQSAERILVASGLKTSESISVLVENPKQIILDEAAQWGADLIFVGSHGRHGLDRFLLGSVSEAVATHAKCSVEVVRV
ncbi:MAG TPA: universal stress protein [Bryobacteraceae bacterium]|jgi:nucleotide-binding universal stress UspA family protein|nr:universal stress protein [Bryobacteraceae bacterium]